MSERNAIASLLIDRKIKTKIALGFACVLTILAITSGTAHFAFRSAAGNFATLMQRVTVVGIARDVDRSFVNLRRAIREYAFTGAERSYIAANAREAATVRGLLQQGLTVIENPDRHRRAGDHRGARR